MNTVCIVHNDREQTLTISSDKARDKMIKDDLIYPCDSDDNGDHEYHLNPFKTFTIKDVEFLFKNLEPIK